ncbi:MAG TPA: DUF5056 domain-containing protein [Prevotella sp.]
MMENEDKWLQQFFDDNRLEIADEGFSRRVMQALPDRVNHAGRIWTVLCLAACVAFVLFSGALNWLSQQAVVIYGDVVGAILSFQPGLLLPVILYMAVLGFVSFFTYKIAITERLSID